MEKKRFYQRSRFDLVANNTKNLATNPTPESTINQDQNWNHPATVPSNNKTLATTAAPTQKIRLPKVSATRLIGERKTNRTGRMIIWSIATAKMKLITAVKSSMWAAGLAGAGTITVELPNG
jgi:hypothetical protein